jgi:hypothetical protein
MNNKLKIISIIILILILFHLKQFLKRNNKYEILQINNKINNFDKYFNENLPIVLKGYNIEMVRDNLSPLTIKKNNIDKFNIENLYMTHCRYNLFIYSQNEIKINISTPDQYNNFEFNKYKYPIKLLNSKSNSFSSISILLRPGNLLHIPRFWILNLEKNLDISIFYSETIFSYFFTKLK